MEKILSSLAVSVSELKKSPAKVIEKAQNSSIVVLNHNKPCAYILSPEQYLKLLESAEEKVFEDMVRERVKEKEDKVEISLNEL